MIKSEKINKAEQQIKLADLKKLVSKQFPDSAVAFSGFAGEIISSGCIDLDIKTGVGGFPSGRIVEIFGEESSGKTTVALTTVRNAVKNGWTVAYVDAEHALDAKWAKVLGVDLDNDILLSQPDSLEDVFEVTELLVTSGAKLVVMDTWSAPPAKAEVEGDSGDMNMGIRPRIMGQFLKKITPLLRRHNVLLLILNQTRDEFSGMRKPGMPAIRKSADSKQLKFYSSIRIQAKSAIANRAGSDEEELATSSTTKFTVIKNKVAAPYRAGEWTIKYGVGFDNSLGYYRLALGYGLITKTKSTFIPNQELIKLGYDKDSKAIGTEKAKTLFFAPGLYEKAVELIHQKLITEGIPKVEDEEETENSYE